MLFIEDFIFLEQLQVLATILTVYLLIMLILGQQYSESHQWFTIFMHHLNELIHLLQPDRLNYSIVIYHYQCQQFTIMPMISIPANFSNLHCSFYLCALFPLTLSELILIPSFIIRVFYSRPIFLQAFSYQFHPTISSFPFIIDLLIVFRFLISNELSVSLDYQKKLLRHHHLLDQVRVFPYVFYCAPPFLSPSSLFLFILMIYNLMDELIYQ